MQLLVAAQHGHLEGCKEAVEMGAKVDEIMEVRCGGVSPLLVTEMISPQGQNAVLIAAANGHAKLIRYYFQELYASWETRPPTLSPP